MQAETSKLPRKAILVITYILAAVLLDLSSRYFVTQAGLAVNYPPAGLYLAAVLILGWPALPLAFISPLFSMLVTLGETGVSLPTALAIGAVSMISPALALFTLRRTGPNSLALHNLKRVSIFALTVMLAVAVEATASGLIYTGTGLASQEGFLETAGSWWISNVVPMLTLTPMILLIYFPLPYIKMRWNGWPGLLAFSIVVFTPLLVWFTLVSTGGGTNRLYICLLPVFAGALTGGVFGACWSCLWLVISVLMLSPHWLVVPQALVETQFFLLAATLSGLVTGSVVTDRRQVELGLRHSEQRFRLLAENSTDMISQQTLNGKYLYVSPASQGLLGLAPEEMLGKTAYEFIHPEDQAVVERLHRSLLDPSSSSNTITYRLRRKDGSYVYVETISRSVLDARSGQPVSITCSTRDASQRKQVEAELQHLNASLEERVARRTEELEMKNRELETFAYSVAHDLKAPLRGIAGYSQLLEEDYGASLHEDGHFYLKTIQSAAIHMAQLIEDLLTYARLERSRLELSLVDIELLVQNLLEERKAEIQARGVQVHFELSCSEVMADPGGLTQALRNLLDNALKFTSQASPPCLEIGSRLERGNVRLWVKDNGIGFDIQYQERIFEIFQRLHRQEDYPGTGIGLALVRKVAERHGGRVWAESFPGNGATFNIELPQV